MAPLVLFAVALLVRVVAGLANPGPAYPDSYYYVNVAHQLAAGNGFQIDYIWNFVDVGGRLPQAPTLPIPSNAHWMPLASMIQVPFIWVLGETPTAYGLPFWLVGALAAPLTWLIGRDAGLDGRTSFAGGLLVAAPGGVTPLLGQPDNFGLYMTLGALALWLAARGYRGDRRAYVVGGLVVGLATLSRNDGLLLGVPFALVGLADLLRTPAARRVGLKAAVGCAVLFVIVMAPWWLRQLEAFGSISPSAASGRILWITEYDELWSVTGTPTPSTLLDQGFWSLLVSRLDGLVTAVGIYALMPLMAVLTPLFVVGLWRHRHDIAFRPFMLYAAILFGASAVLFAVHVPHGTFIHSAVALLPHTFLLVPVGLVAVVTWIARRRSTWDVRRATAMFTAALIFVALFGSAFRGAIMTAYWTERQADRAPLVERLRQEPVSDRVMSADPGAYKYWTGRGGVVTPTDPLPVIEGALRAYDVRWLALERNSIVAALAPVLAGETRPAWLSEPVVVVADAQDQRYPRAVLFAVCLSPDDDRCDE
jgi:hypothetical protein